MNHSKAYVIGFSAVLCLICSIVVSMAAVGLKDRQETNKALDRQMKVLIVAGLMEEGKSATPDEIQSLFKERIKARLVTLSTGKYAEGDADSFDQKKAASDPETSSAAPANNAKVPRVPNQAVIYQVLDKSGKKVEATILPIVGKGLWSTMYGFLALKSDNTTILGITFYQHGETPGLGGEIENPRWKKLWVGRKAFDMEWKPAIKVIKGQAGSVDSDPYQVDGLSGATITSRGVSSTVQFWLGESGFGPYLANVRSGGTGE